MSFAATMATENVAADLCESPGVSLRGPTFMGNPLACARQCLAGSDQSYDLTTMIGHIQDQLERELAPAEFPAWRTCRCWALSAWWSEGTREHGADPSRFREKGRVVRPFGKLVYVMPPFIIRDWELQRLTSALLHVISYLK
ncbi:MAG: aminotransferase class III-fold pyridoxal phosphate-dependent enzyme [Butyricimonas faecihominis]